MRRECFALIAVVTLGCRTPRPCPHADATTTQWTLVTADGADVAIPAGWELRARASVDSAFDVYSRDHVLVVLVSMVRASEPDVSLRQALQRRLDEASAPGELRMSSQREGWWYDESVIESGRLVAACAVDYDAATPVAATPVAILATIRETNGRSLSRLRYEQAGGREMLCGIAASVRLTQ